MALTPTVLAKSQNMLRLSVPNGGEGADSAVLTQAALVALCAAGPLQAMLTAPLFDGTPGPGAATWALLVDDARLSVFGIGFGTTVSAGYSFTTDSSVNHINLFVGQGGTAVFELRFEQSTIR